MNSPTRLQRRLAAGLLLIGVAALPVAQAAAKQPEPLSVPTKIQVGEGHRVFLVGHAVGVQIYRCNPTADGHAWGLVAPRAELYDDQGKAIVTHSAGPSWQARDGSAVVGKRVDGVIVDTSAIPWLLLSATPTDTSPADGRLAGTKFIQRVATVGGLPPEPGTCNADTVGTVEEIDYTADYYFWKAD